MSACAVSARGRRSIFKGLAGILAAVFIVLGPASSSAGPALVFDVRSGEVLHSHQPFARWYPASLTKMMTAYVTFRAIRQGRINLDSPVHISPQAHAQPPSKIGYPVGTRLSVDHALRIIIVRSANDVSVALGEAVSGSIDTFIGEMNAAAARLGMTDTSFVNPHGLPDSRQVSTARDLALLTRALIAEYPEYQFIFSARAIELGGSTHTNHNRLLGTFHGADGMKTGYTCSSGFNLAASATRDGRRIVAILLGGPTAARRNEVVAGLLEAGFRKSQGFRLFSRNPRLSELQRPSAVAEPVDLRPYVCQNQPMPEHLASFGTLGTIEATGGEAPAAAAVAGFAPAPPAPEDGRATDVRPSRGITAQNTPLPRPRPMLRERDGASALGVERASASRGRRGLSLPMPDFLRTPADRP